MEEPVTVLGRAIGPRGEVLLRRRDTGGERVEELVVNGVFAMDSAETTSERRLAGFGLVDYAAHPRVLVGGLGSVAPPRRCWTTRWPRQGPWTSSRSKMPWWAGPGPASPRP